MSLYESEIIVINTEEHRRNQTPLKIYILVLYQIGRVRGVCTHVLYSLLMYVTLEISKYANKFKEQVFCQYFKALILAKPCLKMFLIFCAGNYLL